MKGLNIKKYLLILAVCAIIAIIAYSSGTNKSSTNAAYRTQMTGSDSARVAKWDIKSLDRNGEAMSLSADVQNIENGSGNWFLEVENLSEVAAKFGSDSKIILRLDSDIFEFDTYKGTNEWNFIKATVDGSLTALTNPIRFVVYVYDCPLSEVLSYQFKEGSVIEDKTIEEYNELSDYEKSLCTEVISNSAEKYVVFDTSTTGKVKLEHKNDGSTSYLYQEFNISDFLRKTDSDESELVIDGFGINSNTKKCIRIEWSVNGSISGNLGNTDKFNIYDKETGSLIDSVDMFDYQKYISSLKGEPTYQITTDDGVITVGHSKLTQTQKDAYYNKTTGTLYEQNTYAAYENFLTKQKEYLQTLGYLECGLSCSIIFNIKVEQQD